MLLSPSQYALWLVSILCEGWLLGILIGRKRKFPAFKAYIAFCVVRSLILFALACYERPTPYFYVYFVGIGLETAFLLAVCTEITIRVFNPWLTIPLGSKKVFTYTFGLFVVLTLVAVKLSPEHPNATMAVWRSFERGAVIITFGWFSSLAVLSTYLRLPWRKHCYGIGTGFILNLSIQSVGLTVVSGFGHIVGNYIRYIVMGGFLLAEIAWIVYLRSPEPELRLVTKPELERVYELIRTFDRALNARCLLKEIPQGDGLTSKLFPTGKFGPNVERTNCERLAGLGSNDRA